MQQGYSALAVQIYGIKGNGHDYTINAIIIFFFCLHYVYEYMQHHSGQALFKVYF